MILVILYILDYNRILSVFDDIPDISGEGDGGGKCEGGGAPGTAIDPTGGATPLIEDP